jgi:hypothetical protein
MRQIKLSNGVEIRAYVGDGVGRGLVIYVSRPVDKGPDKEQGQWGHPIPHKDLPRVIRLLEWYEKQAMKLRYWEGTMWRHIASYKDDYPALPSTSSPYQAAFYRGHLRSHLHKCGCGKDRTK